jgi:hypothetical protein
MLSFLLNIIFLIVFIIVYLHVYIHFRVTNNNEFIELDDICRNEITNNIYYKQPFYFDGTSISHKLDLNDSLKTSHKGYDVYKLIYEPLPLLEPNVKFFPKTSAYYYQKANKHSEVERNLECRNFYFVHSGKVRITCIHPKYSEHFLHKVNKNTIVEFIKKNENMLNIELEPNMILFVPNYWYVFMESMEKNTCVEKIQYKTILNNVNFMYHKYLKY